MVRNVPENAVEACKPNKMDQVGPPNLVVSVPGRARRDTNRLFGDDQARRNGDLVGELGAYITSVPIYELGNPEKLT